MHRSTGTALAFSLIIALTACEARSGIDPRAARPILRLAAGTGIVSTLRSLHQFSFQTADIGDSQERLVALQKGSIDLAVTVADLTYVAFNGQVPDRSRPLDRVRGIALLQPAIVHLLVGPTTSPRRRFRDVRVVLGITGGINDALGERLMSSMFTTSEIRGEFLPRDTAVEELLKGNINSLIVTGRPPQQSVTRALQGGARLLDIDGSKIDTLRAYYPLLRRMVIPRGTYQGQDAHVHTIRVDLLLVCRADLDNNLVYELTRSYFEDTPENIRDRTDPQRAPAVVIPLHPGAARYYREREMRR
jgi:TRAP transporter TAXI family solute receptor